ncbi:hypothetical protein [Stygiolobus caldivivus]|uniref:HAD family hydrolase n=1 Tax=Stygiolobus caldivivus TaxID=2824673 RepID=A0A8D5U664_9CREN|nr:hypothetical protein [Stygiolobus caldivivus]BCU69987.1 hypothetical protein KN1_12840 [Stygiolobus caldivivus]
MIFIDLDNTLYNQEQYLKPVFRKIAKAVQRKCGTNSRVVYEYLVRTVRAKTMHYPVFDSLVEDMRLDIDPKDLVKSYRELSIEYFKNKGVTLYKNAVDLLKRGDVVVYTEGRKEFQGVKIKSIEEKYGLKLNYIVVEDKLNEENVRIFKEYSPAVYIGDDVFRDFFIPNKLKIVTIRVLTGLYRGIPNTVVEESYRPKITVRNLNCLIL